MNKFAILAVIAEETGKPVTEATPVNELGLDSLEFLNLLVVIENAFGVRVDDSALPENATMGDIVAAVLA